LVITLLAAHQSLTGLAVAARQRRSPLPRQLYQGRKAHPHRRGKVHETAAGRQRRIRSQRAGRQHHRVRITQRGLQRFEIGVLGPRWYRGLGGGHVDHDDPGQGMPLPEPAQVLSQPARSVRLRATVGHRVITGPQLDLDRAQPVPHTAEQPVRHHSLVGEQLSALVQRRVHDVVPADHEVMPARQGEVSQRRVLGDAADRLGQPGPQCQQADDGRRGHRAAGSHQPQPGAGGGALGRPSRRHSAIR
jgi:hypothetical protein